MSGRRSYGIEWVQAIVSAPWTGRHYHTSVVFENKIWVIGGYDGRWKNDVWCSSDGVNWMQIIDSAPWPIRCAQSSVVYDNKMWVIGGVNRTNKKFVYLNDVWYSNDGKENGYRQRMTHHGRKGMHPR